MEFRIKNVDISCSTEDMTVGGYINVTQRDSEVMYSKKRNKWFKEVIRQGAFKRSLSQNSNIPLLLEHDFNAELAHTNKGTFSVEEDQIGLKFTAKLEDRAVYEKVQKGIINNCSFGFRVVEEDFESINSKLERRYINDLTLVECSLVSNPAYLGSLVETRELEDALNEDKNEEMVEEMIEETNEINDTHNNSDNGQSIIDENQTESESVEEEKEEVVEEISTEEKTMGEDEVVDDKEVIETKSYEDNIVAHDVIMQEDTKEVPTQVVEEVANVVDEIIEKKEQQLQNLQGAEEGIANIIEEVKEEHKQVEKNLESEAIRLSTDVLRLRLELLKLKTIKKELA